jgi:hypothetical protein
VSCLQLHSSLSLLGPSSFARHVPKVTSQILSVFFYADTIVAPLGANMHAKRAELCLVRVCWHWPSAALQTLTVESEGVRKSLGVCRLLKDLAEGPYKTKHAKAN